MSCGCSRCRGEGPEEKEDPRPSCWRCVNKSECEEATEDDRYTEGEINWFKVATEYFEEDADECEHYEWDGEIPEPDYDDRED